MESGGCIALLDLPEQTTISIDAGPNQTLRKSEECIIIRDIFPVDKFHFLVVRGGLKTRASHHQSVLRSQPAGLHNVGIVLLFESSDYMLQINTNDSPHWLIARKFDPFTEELSSIPPDDATMESVRSILDPKTIPHYPPTPVINYKGLLQASGSETDDREHQLDAVWSDSLTHYITREILSRHGVTGHGDKIIPSSFTLENDADVLSLENVCGNREERCTDGIAIRYPLIPIIDQKLHTNQKHKATREYLMSLSPEQRTQLLFHEELPGCHIFHYVLNGLYDGKWTVLLGDFQLAFVLFLCLGCFQSFEFWRDLLTMLSFVTPEIVDKHSLLFQQLLHTLHGQILRFDKDLFTDVEYSEGSFLFPTLSRLAAICRRSSTNLLYLKDFELALEEKSRITATHTDEDEQSSDIESDRCDEDLDEESDPPVILTSDEIEAAMDRTKNTNPKKTSDDNDIRALYPLLFAATLDHEDVLMACARLLDESIDASLLREVTNYLENVEAKSYSIQ